MGNPTQPGYKSHYPRRPKTDVAKFGGPSLLTARREEKTKTNTEFRKTHSQDGISPTYQVNDEPLPLGNKPQGIQSHMFFKVKTAKMWQFKTPAR
jgi:hypothetical protein